MSLKAEATRALSRAIWRENFNKQWRFSSVKSGLWLALAQIAVVAVFVGNLRSGQFAGTAVTAFLMLALQAGLGSFFSGFLRGRMTLFIDKTLPLVHTTPTQPSSLILAQVLGELPSRMWSAVLLTAIFATMLPTGALVWGIPSLWLTGVVVGTLAQWAGLFALMMWVQLAPRSLGAVWYAFLAMWVGVIGYVGWLLVGGATLESVGEAIAQVQGAIVGAMLLLFGLPGVVMGGYMLVSPRRAGAAYRKSWLRYQEFSQRQGSNRSTWPALVGRTPGAVQAKEWLQIRRNPVTLFRLGFLGAGLAGLYWAGSAVSGLGHPRADFLRLLLAFVVTLFSVGEIGASMYNAEGGRFALYIVTGVRPAKLLLGKAVTGIPLVPVAMLCTWAVSLGGGAEIPQQLGDVLVGAVVGLGMALIIAGIGALDAGKYDVEGENRSDFEAAAFEQVPRGIGAWGAMGAALLYSLLGAALASDSLGGLALLLYVSLVLLPPLALVPGYLRLRKVLH
jgi:hypothetical protein